MYITCQNCDTMFRLDEQLLKPSGSKVRCSQCSHVFVAYPPPPETPSPAVEEEVPPAAGLAFTSEETEPKVPAEESRDGINLAELDAILEEAPSFDSELADASAESVEAPLIEDTESEPETAFDESDLDMDFDLDDAGTVEKQPVEETAGEPEKGADDDLDLGDFFLDEDTTPQAGEGEGLEERDGSEELSLDLDELPLEQSGELPADLLGGEDQQREDELETLSLDSDIQGADDFGLEELAASIESSEIESSEDELEELVLDGEPGELGLDLEAEPQEDVAFLPDDAISEIEEVQAEEIDLEFGEAVPEELETTETELSLDEELDIGELDGDLDQLLDEEAPPDVPADVPADAALDTLADKAPVEAADSTTEVSAELDGLDLDLDLDLELDDQKEAGALPVAESDVSLDDSFLDGVSLDEDLDLDLDGADLSFDEGGEPETAGEDLELSLEDAAAQEPVAKETSDELDGLDLSDFDDIIADGDEDVGEATAEPDEDIELSLSLDEEPEEADQLSFDESALKEEPAVELSSGDDDLDLDLSDLDDMLSDGEQVPEGELDLALDDLGEDIGEDLGSGLEDVVGEETELALDLDETPLASEGTPEGTPKGTIDDTDVSEQISLDAGEPEEAGGEELEDLDFALDEEFEDKPAAKSSAEPDQPPAAEDEDEEIDLSDIEEMLEGGGLATGADASSSEAEIDFGEEETIAGDEFDLSEFEAAIDEAEAEPADEGPDAEEGELEFDLSLDEDEAAPVGDAEEEEFDLTGDETLLDGDLELELDLEGQDESGDLDLALEGEKREGDEEQFALEDDEFDLSDLSALVDEPGKSKKSEIVDTGDIELEFEIEEKLETPEPSISVTSAPLGAPGRTSDAATELAIDKTTTAPGPSEKEPLKPRPVPAKPKKKKSKALVVVFVLILLAGGGYLGYDYVVKNDIQIPYISDFLNPRPKDPNGILNLSTLEINSKFIENETGGRLFVITGKVRNGYQNTRSMISLRGKLFTQNKVLVKTERTYAGITLSDQELSIQPVQEIKTELKTTPKPQDIGTMMRPGQVLPFMLVFSDLPEDLDEFVIETISSQAVTQ